MLSVICAQQLTPLLTSTIYLYYIVLKLQQVLGYQLKKYYQQISENRWDKSFSLLRYVILFAMKTTAMLALTPFKVKTAPTPTQFT